MTEDEATSDEGTLLVGVANPATIPRLMGLAADLALQTERRIVVTNIVTVPLQSSLASKKHSPEVSRATVLLRKAIRNVADRQVQARGVVEVAREPDEGMISAAASQNAKTLLVGYSDEEPGVASRAEKAFDRIMHRVARSANCDLLVAKFRRDEVSKILVPVAGAGVNYRLTGPLVQALAKHRGASVQFLHVIQPSADSKAAEQKLTAFLEEQGLQDLGPLEVVQAEDPIALILERCKDCDLAIVGTDARATLTDAIFGNPAENLAAHAHCSVFLVRASSGG